MLRHLLYSLLYFPSRAIVETPGGAGLEYRDLALDTDDGERLHGWWVPARARPVGHVLFCHGNAGNVGDRVLHADLLTAAGFDVLLFDYRGYGDNPGRPSEEALYRDARAAREYLSRREDVDTERLVYFGESLGAAVVVKLATEHPPAGLVLRSPFTSLAAVGKLHYRWLPVGWMLKDRYESLAAIKGVHVPVLVIAGGSDAIIPATQSRALHDAAAGPKRFVLIEGADHNDAELFVGPEVLAAVGRFLDEVT